MVTHLIPCCKGCKVVIASRKEEQLLKAAEEMKNTLREKSPDVISIVCNIRKEEEVKNLVQATLAKYGRIDFLINNGGGQFLCPVGDLTTKGWDAVIETNLKVQAVYDKWMKDNGGVIINILIDFERGLPLAAVLPYILKQLLRIIPLIFMIWLKKIFLPNAWGCLKKNHLLFAFYFLLVHHLLRGKHFMLMLVEDFILLYCGKFLIMIIYQCLMEKTLNCDWCILKVYIFGWKRCSIGNRELTIFGLDWYQECSFYSDCAGWFQLKVLCLDHIGGQMLMKLGMYFIWIIGKKKSLIKKFHISNDRCNFLCMK
nr:uncharacterized protein LOC107446647 isoform X2 [Parasteatoda tepidariorum]